ncbi:unnamed protein product [Symbiodinium natans]|uniref:Uncharacterized protein n=1 Tax=Symbiodinium natans TaxID=878477 RepID=A0A812JAW6_9DINO|nr:unnamed protein product [Symbiodinium natans]
MFHAWRSQALQDSSRVQLLKETMTEKPDKIKKKPRVSSKERKQSWSSGRLETIKKKLEEFIRTGMVSDCDYEEEQDGTTDARAPLVTTNEL